MRLGREGAAMFSNKPHLALLAGPSISIGLQIVPVIDLEQSDARDAILA